MGLEDAGKPGKFVGQLLADHKLPRLALSLLETRSTAAAVGRQG
jgi:hypothetical protein